MSVFYDALKSSKVVQSDPVFGIQGLYTSMSLCARFQISVSSGYVQPFNVTDRQTDRQTDGFYTEYMNSSDGWLAS